MKTITKASVAAIALALFGIAPASAEKCPVSFNQDDGLHASCTDPQIGPQGPKGEKGDTGADGKDGADGQQGIQGIAGIDGKDGKDGIDGKDGLDGKDFDPSDMERGLAVSAALTVPHIDIGKSFGIAISPAFFNDEAAIGGGVAFRLDDTWQLGGSVSTDFDGKDVAGKGVLTGQW